MDDELLQQQEWTDRAEQQKDWDNRTEDETRPDGFSGSSASSSALVDVNATPNRPHPFDKFALPADEAIDEFADMLIDRWVHGHPAKDVCIQCWWMKCAGLGGLIADMAYPPGQPTGKYKPHLRKVIGLDVLADRRLDT